MEVVAGGVKQPKVYTLVWIILWNIFLVLYLTWWNICDCHQAQTMRFGKDFDNQHLASKNNWIPEAEGETLGWYSCNIAMSAGLSGELQRGKCCLTQQSSRTGTFGVVWSLFLIQRFVVCWWKGCSSQPYRMCDNVDLNITNCCANYCSLAPLTFRGNGLR